MFFASCAATAGHAAEPIGSMPFPAGGRSFPAAAPAPRSATRTAAAASFIAYTLRLQEPQHQAALARQRGVDRRDAVRRLRVRELQPDGAGAANRRLALRAG